MAQLRERISSMPHSSQTWTENANSVLETRYDTSPLLHLNIHPANLCQRPAIRRREWEVDTVQRRLRSPFAEHGVGISHLVQKLGEALCQGKLAYRPFLPSSCHNGASHQESRL